MPRRLHTPTVLHNLDRGRSVALKTSSRKLVFVLCLALVIGAFLAGLLVIIVNRSLEENVSWMLFAFNLRIWALVIGILGCLVLAPVAVAFRLRRSEALLLSHKGLVESHRGVVLPSTFLAWNEIERIDLGTVTARPGPKCVIYQLTPESIQRRGRKGLFAGRIVLRTGFELRQRQLFELLSAAHARYSTNRQ